MLRRLIYGVIGVIAAIGGCFLTAWGIAMLSHWMISPAEVFTKPVFWVLLALLAWFCLFFAALFIFIKRRTMVWRLIYVLVGLIATVGVCYFTAWGIFRVVFWEISPAMIFTKPLFWGLLTILGGLYFLLPALVISIKGKNGLALLR